MDTTLNLNWIRESSHGLLEADLGTPLDATQLELGIIGLLPAQQPGKVYGGVRFTDLRTPWLLPEWARRTAQQFFGGNPQAGQLTLVEALCDRIRHKVPENACNPHVFLPYFDRREWNERFSVLPRLGFEGQPGGVVAIGVQPHSVRETAMRIAAGVYSKMTPHVPVKFESRLPLNGPWRTALLERYGIGLAPEAPALAEFTLETTGEDLNAWAQTPRERHCHYYDVFSRMSLALQNGLRRWTLAAYAHDLERLADFDNGADMLAYSAVRPHVEKKARDFSYDVLNQNMMDTAFGRSARRMEPLLQTAQAVLKGAGREEEAKCYLKRDLRLQANRLAQRARRRPRVRMMLVSEGVLIYSLMKFANRLKSLDSPRAVNQVVDELAHDFNERVRKMFYFLPQTEEVGTMIFLEATNAIHCAMGGEPVLLARCQTLDGGTHRGVGKIEPMMGPSPE